MKFGHIKLTHDWLKFGQFHSSRSYQNFSSRSWLKIGRTWPRNPILKIGHMRLNYTKSTPTKIHSNLVESTPPKIRRIWADSA